MRTEYIDNNPYTVYEIEVIENIKGGLILSKPIEFMQFGGLNKDKKSYTLVKNTSLLKKNEYYIILCNAFGAKEGSIETSSPDKIISLGKDYKSNENISTYKKAYENQIVPDNYESNGISKYDINYSKLDKE